MKKGAARFVVGICAVALLASCAAFREGRLEPIPTWPLASGATQTLAYSIHSEIYRNGALLAESGATGTDYYARHIELMYRQSGLFSSVTRGRVPADVYAEMRTVQRLDESIGMAIVSGLTLTMVPAVSRNEMTLSTTFKDREGRTIGSIEKAEGTSVWIQGFLIFLTPFQFPGRIQAWAVNDLARTTLQDALARGWLGGPKAAATSRLHAREPEFAPPHTLRLEERP